MNEFVCVPVVKSSKKGVDYIALEITFPGGYKKIVFLEQAEQFLVKL